MNLELLDFVWQIQQPTVDRNTFGLWNVDIWWPDILKHTYFSSNRSDIITKESQWAMSYLSMCLVSGMAFLDTLHCVLVSQSFWTRVFWFFQFSSYCYLLLHINHSLMSLWVCVIKLYCRKGSWFCRASKVRAMERLCWSPKISSSASVWLCNSREEKPRGLVEQGSGSAKAAGQGRGKACEGTAARLKVFAQGFGVKPRWPGAVRDQPWCCMVTMAGGHMWDDLLWLQKNVEDCWFYKYPDQRKS